MWSRIACRKPVWAYSRNEFEEGIKDPTVVHFTTCFMSGTRPWFKNDHLPYRDEFLKYRNLTGWKNEPIWEDNTKLAKKAMTKIANFLPKTVTFAIIRIVHVWVYPTVRNIKSSIKGLAQ